MLGILKRGNKRDEKDVVRKYPVGLRVPPNKEVERLVREALNKNDRAIKQLKKSV